MKRESIRHSHAKILVNRLFYLLLQIYFYFLCYINTVSLLYVRHIYFRHIFVPKYLNLYLFKE